MAYSGASMLKEVLQKAKTALNTPAVKTANCGRSDNTCVITGQYMCNQPMWNHWSAQESWKTIRWRTQQNMRVKAMTVDLQTAATTTNDTCIGSKKNPIRSTRMLLLNEQNMALAGSLYPKTGPKKSFSPEGLPAHIHAISEQAELWLPGGKVDMVQDVWEQWDAAACRELQLKRRQGYT